MPMTGCCAKFTQAVATDVCATTVNRLSAPGTSRNGPKSAPGGTPARLAPPERVILPRANGVPALGRTRTPDQLILARAFVLPLPESCVETVVVMVVVATVITLDNVNSGWLPLSSRVTAAVTVELVSNTNPAGALNIIVPVPTSRLVASE